MMTPRSMSPRQLLITRAVTSATDQAQDAAVAQESDQESD